MNIKKENNYNLTFITIGFYFALQIFSDIGSLKIIKLFGYSILLKAKTTPNLKALLKFAENERKK